ncbi:MAG: hypothetical protein KDC43_24795, partial [Saprospiraceae bacterium]|nr:hypothetical protein [Saprospiraceae bacterium]
LVSRRGFSLGLLGDWLIGPNYPITQLPNYPITQLPNYPITQLTKKAPTQTGQELFNIHSK